MKNKKGFSLVELLAVIALLAIVVVFAVPKVLDSYNTAQKNTLVDEAKMIYTEATNKYLKERINGNKITNISNETNSLDLSNEDINYNIRLDSDGNVTALKVKNKKYCIVSKSNEIEDATAEDVISLSDDLTGKCENNTLMDGEIITLDLKIKNASRPIVNDATPTTIYLKYNSGWYDKKTTKGKTISSLDTLPRKKNYYFGGYKLSSDESLVIDYTGKILVDKIGYVSGKAVLNDISQTTSKAYATFEKKYYKAKLTANGGTGSDVLVTVNYGEKVNLPKNTFTKTGYSFNGWKNTFNESFSDEQQLTYIDDDNEESLSNYRFNVNKVVGSSTDNIITYNAQWKANNYTVYFNANGGSVSTSSKTVTFDSALGELPTPTYGGHVFSGWYTASSGGTQVTSSTIYKTDGNSTYYARYDGCPAGSYCPGDNKVYPCAAGTYSTGNATSCTTCNSGNYTDTGDSTGATSCTICPAGYSCNGKTKTICSAGTYAVAGKSSCTTCNSGSYTNTGNSAGASTCTTCPAGYKCDGKIKTICNPGYYSKGGSAYCDSCYAGYHQSQSGSSSCVICPAGYYSYSAATYCRLCKSGYYTNTGNSGGASSCYSCPSGYSCNGKTKTACAAGTFSTGSASSCTSCAVGSYNTGTANTSCKACSGGKTTSSSGSTSCNSNCSNNSNVSTWTSTSWSNNSVTNLCTISSCKSGYDLSSNKCVANTFTITYNAGGGSGTMASTTCTYGQTCKLSSNAFTKTGYTFNGWAKASGAVIADYGDGADVTNVGSMTLTAIWKANTYTISYNSNSGSGTMSTTSCTYDSNCTLRVNSFVKIGYSFNVWNTKSDGTGTSYSSGASVSNLATTGTVTLYAQWEGLTYYIAYDANGGSGTMNKTTCTYGQSCTLASNTFTRTGYEFNYWKNEDTSLLYGNGGTVNNLIPNSEGKIFTLTAIWNRTYIQMQVVDNDGIYIRIKSGSSFVNSSPEMILGGSSSYCFTINVYSIPEYNAKGHAYYEIVPGTYCDGKGNYCTTIDSGRYIYSGCLSNLGTACAYSSVCYG